MAGEWREETLANLCLYINRGAAPAYVDEGGVLVLNQKCVRDQRVSFEEARRTDHELKPITPERMVRRWDVLVNSTGVGTLGRVAQLDVVPEPASVDSHVTIVRPDPDAVYPRFLGFVIRAFEREIESLAEGSTGQTELARTRLASLSVPVAPEDEQRAIAHILGTLDDKIELNRRMNETLEAMARALFKSWFVDFLPVRAKMAARTQTGDPVRLPAATAAQAGAKAESRPGGTGLPKTLADLFPDSFEDSELGEVPKGWEVLPLGDLLDLAYGKALKEENRQPGIVPVFGSNGQVGWHNEALVTGPGIIVGRKGNPGIVTWAPTNFFCIDTTFYVVPKEQGRSLHFLYYALRAQDLALLGADSAVPGLNRNLAYMSKQLVPHDSILDAFDAPAGPLFQRGHHNDQQSSTLAALRDTLLPKLLSGELRVKNAERFVSEVA